MKRIVGIHGVGQHRPGLLVPRAANELEEAWLKALARGAASARAPELSVVYYADLLRIPGRQGGALSLDDLEPAEEELVREWLRELNVPAGVSAGRATGFLRQSLAWLARSRGIGAPATEWFVSTFFREVHTYLQGFDGSARFRVRARIAETVAARRPDIVIAHSLGSVAAYEALWAYPHLKVDLLITLGSPLALPHAVFDRLEPGPVNGRGRRPPGVRRWVNLADPGDLVAIPPGGVEAKFDGVDSERSGTVAIHTFDFHLVANYLASSRVADLLGPGPT
ncbi:hypothetical protein ACH4GM_08525 [Streptomyces coeruleorubidus]|uniref:hypothetical protein n=1 Tax=Streptomyces coeruleorubidus TaxID=116188 RepID=UPI003787D97D